MKKIISIILSVVMLLCVCSVLTSASWSEDGYIIVIADAVRTRTGAGVENDVVPGVTYTYGDTLGIASSGRIEKDSNGVDWLKIADNQYICMNYVTTYFSAASISSGKVINVNTNLAVRKAPTTKAPSIGSLKNDANVKITAETHYEIDGQKWYQIEYGDRYTRGWISANYIGDGK